MLSLTGQLLRSRQPEIGWFLGEQVGVVVGQHHPPGPEQLLPPVGENRHEPSYRPPPIRHLEALPGLHPGEVPARLLPQLPHPDALHVLHGST